MNFGRQKVEGRVRSDKQSRPSDTGGALGVGGTLLSMCLLTTECPGSVVELGAGFWKLGLRVGTLGD